MNEYYMKVAIEEAKKALLEGEVPVGAVIVKNNKIVAKAHNQKEFFNCATKHAELLVIEKASKILKNWRLCDCEIYITLEPCPMCASAIKQSRINTIYYGLKNFDDDNFKIIEKIWCKDKNNSACTYESGILSDEILEMMKKFFQCQRNK